MDSQRRCLSATILLFVVFALLMKTTIWQLVKQKSQQHIFSSVESTDQVHSKPQCNIYFSKIHKTGSTTMKNVILRYSWKNNLRFATYKSVLVGLNSTDILMADLIPPFLKVFPCGPPN